MVQVLPTWSMVTFIGVGVVGLLSLWWSIISIMSTRWTLFLNGVAYVVMVNKHDLDECLLCKIHVCYNACELVCRGSTTQTARSLVVANFFLISLSIIVSGTIKCLDLLT